MFTSILVVLLIIKSIVFLKSINWKVNLSCVGRGVFFEVTLALYVIFLITIFSLSELPTLIFGKYLTLMSPDSWRYYKEILIFQVNPFSVDELNGSFQDYQVTPKLGFSVLVSMISFFFRITSMEGLYGVMNFILCLLTISNIFLYRKLSLVCRLKGYPYVICFILIFLFPSDLYWSFRFLREAVANSFMIGAGLTCFLYLYSGDKKFLFNVIIYFLFLVIFRAPLALFFWVYLCFMLVFFRKMGPVNFLICLLMGGLACVQFNASSGKGSLFLFFNLLGMDFGPQVYFYFLELSKDVSRALFILLFSGALVASFYKFKLSSPAFLSVIKRTFLIVGLIIVLSAILLLTRGDFQLRFIYPILMLIKISLIMILMHRPNVWGGRSVINSSVLKI